MKWGDIDWRVAELVITKSKKKKKNKKGGVYRMISHHQRVLARSRYWNIPASCAQKHTRRHCCRNLVRKTGNSPPRTSLGLAS
jgi:hypothetical protein